MSADSPEKAPPEIPSQIFEKFLDELGKDGLSADLIGRLRRVLLEEKRLTEAAIRAALLSDDEK